MLHELTLDFNLGSHWAFRLNWDFMCCDFVICLEKIAYLF